MVNHTSLAQLDDAQQHESWTARRRIELAEDALGYYRSRMRQVQESFYELGARHGIHDDPGFRAELQHVTDLVDENSGNVGRMIAGLEEDYEAMATRHVDERERFIAEQGKER